jgi:ribonuclease HI
MTSLTNNNYTPISQANLHRAVAAAVQCGARLTGEQRTDNTMTNTTAQRNGFKRRIILVQEPYLSNNKVKFFHNVNVYCSKDNDNRACIATSKEVRGCQLNQFTNRDHTAVLFRFNNKQIIFCSIYCPGEPEAEKKSPPAKILIDLVEYARLKNLPLIIGGDVNSRHLSWGSSETQKRGEDLLEFIISKNLIVLNEGNKPTFANVLRGEVLDITFVSDSLINRVVGWRVSDIESFSDHMYLDFELIENVNLSNSDNFRCIKKTRWREYKSKLAENRGKRGNIDLVDLETAADQLRDDIISAYHDSCPIASKRGKNRPKWWNSNLEESKKLVNLHRRRVSRFRTEERLAEYRVVRNRHDTKVKAAKKKAWFILCQEMDKLDSAARIQKLMKMDNNRELGTVRKPDGEYTNNVKETLNVLLNTHFPDEHDDRHTEPYDHSNNNTNLDIEKTINLETVVNSIKSFKPFKSPGMDGIYPCLLQKGIEILGEDITKLWRRSVRESTCPRTWLDTRVAFIDKPGKKDSLNPKSKRPISLSSFLLKGLERTLFWETCENHLRSTTSKKIYSYKESTNTEDALHAVLAKIEKAKLNGECVIVLFADIDAAFNNASINMMVKNLERMGASKQTVMWTEYMLKHRKVTAMHDDVIVSKSTTRGTPQGSVASVHLWNNNQQNLQDRLPERNPTDIYIFADDILDLAVGWDEISCAHNLQRDIDIMEQWAADHSLSFSASKTKLMLFTKKNNPKLPKIYMYGTELEFVPHFKYLGVTFRSDLKWDLHIRHITDKATTSMMYCRRMISKSWGLNPKICRWLYTAVVRPVMSYAAMIWIEGIKGGPNSKNRKRLEKVQRKGCLATLNGMRSTPTAGMEVMLGVEPIVLHLQAQALNTYKRLIWNGNWTVQQAEITSTKSHAVIIRNLAKNIKSIFLPRDRMVYTQYVPTNFNTKIGSREEARITDLRPGNKNQEDIICFTDGSKMDDRSGFGYIITGGGLKISGSQHLGSNTTVYQAELLALAEAAFTLISKKVKDRNIKFYLDNTSAITALNNYQIRSKVIFETKRLINKLGEDNRILVAWVPGHEGHLGNEVADRRAKLGAKMKIDTPGECIPISDANIKMEIKSYTTRCWQRYWEKLTTCRQTKMMLPSVKNGLWRKLVTKPRRMMNIITQIYTGHATLAYHLKNMEIDDSSGCRQCEEFDDIETVEHYLTECPAFMHARREHLGSIFLRVIDLPTLNVDNILKFIRATGRFEYLED